MKKRHDVLPGAELVSIEGDAREIIRSVVWGACQASSQMEKNINNQPSNHMQPTKTKPNKTTHDQTKPNQPRKKTSKRVHMYKNAYIYIYIYTHTLYKRKTTKNTLGCIKPVGCRLTAYSCLNLHHLHFPANSKRCHGNNSLNQQSRSLSQTSTPRLST